MLMFWLISFIVMLAILFPIALVVWVVIDAKKFKARGINTSPLNWALGVIFFAVIAFSIYYDPS